MLRIIFSLCSLILFNSNILAKRIYIATPDGKIPAKYLEIAKERALSFKGEFDGTPAYFDLFLKDGVLELQTDIQSHCEFKTEPLWDMTVEVPKRKAKSITALHYPLTVTNCEGDHEGKMLTIFFFKTKKRLSATVYYVAKTKEIRRCTNDESTQELAMENCTSVFHESYHKGRFFVVE